MSPAAASRAICSLSDKDRSRGVNARKLESASSCRAAKSSDERMGGLPFDLCVEAQPIRSPRFISANDPKMAIAWRLSAISLALRGESIDKLSQHAIRARARKQFLSRRRMPLARRDPRGARVRRLTAPRRMSWRDLAAALTLAKLASSA